MPADALVVDGVGEAGRHISGGTTGLVISYVRRVLGKPGVDRMLEVAGETRSARELSDFMTWSTYEQAVRLLAAAVDVTGDSQAARRCGEEALRQYAGTEVAALLRELGSPGEVIRNVAATAGKFSSVTVMEPLELHESSAIVSATSLGGQKRHPLFCDYTAGVLSQASVLFGMDPAVVTEPECETRGHTRCVYQVEWDPASSPDGDPARRMTYLEGQLQALTERFEVLQATAAELVQAEDVATALESIVRRASMAVRAPRFLLAVKLPGDHEPRVHADGFSSRAQMDEAVAAILAERPDDHAGAHLIVDVVSARHWYGRLAALHHEGMRFFAAERKILASFASHAAAALESAAALEEARRRNRISSAFLELADALAKVGTPEEVAASLVGAAPNLVDCDASVVYLWNAEAGSLHFVAGHGLDPVLLSVAQHAAILRADAPTIGALEAAPGPVLVSDDGDGDEFLATVFALSGALALAVVPIHAMGELLGVVAVGVKHRAERLRDDKDLSERLAGLAGQAATALHNARLLEHIRHQALHDALTGLPNRVLLHERMEAALKGARRTGEHLALLFLDLDHFKDVNDTLGHAVGDALIREVATRLRGGLREVDTVARIGGDEFAIVVPGVADAAIAVAVAGRLLKALDARFDLAGKPVRTTASVGIVVGGGDDTFEELLAKADAAMYSAKAAGRARWAVHGEGPAEHPAVAPETSRRGSGERRPEAPAPGVPDDSAP